MSAPCRERIERLLDSPRGLVVGLTGGIASGKSTVASMLAERGAEIIDFDKLAREVVKPGMPALAEIADLFGEEVITGAGELNRKALGTVVFGDPEKRRPLEEALHPRIFDLYLEKVTDVFRRNPDAVLVAAVPLLVELGLSSLFHRVVVVYVPGSVQRERLLARDRISAAEADRIIASQMPMEEKLSGADFVILNDAGLDRTRLQVDVLWSELERSRQVLTAKKGLD